MSTSIKKEKTTQIEVVKKMRDYSKESVFKKKLEKAETFLEKNGLPESFTQKKN